MLRYILGLSIAVSTYAAATERPSCQEDQYFSGVISMFNEDSPCGFLLTSYDNQKVTQVCFPEHLVLDAKKFAKRGIPAGLSGSFEECHRPLKVCSLHWED